MNIQQLTEAIKKDLDQIEGIEENPVIEVMKTIMRSAEKHAGELTRKDLWEFMYCLRFDEEVNGKDLWNYPMVLRVCTLEDVIREAMVMSACDSILKDYMERMKL